MKRKKEWQQHVDGISDPQLLQGTLLLQQLPAAFHGNLGRRVLSYDSHIIPLLGGLLDGVLALRRGVLEALLRVTPRILHRITCSLGHA